MTSRKRQNWCFEDTEEVDLKPSLCKLFIRSKRNDTSASQVQCLVKNMKLLGKKDATTIECALSKEGECVFGQYTFDVAETKMQELSEFISRNDLSFEVFVQRT